MNILTRSIHTSLCVLLATIAHARSANIVDTAAGNPDFSILVKALQAADLVDTVRDKSFTVFAPTNEAFEQLPKGTLQHLLKPENKAALVNLLKFHVIPGSGYTLTKLLDRPEWGTAADQPLAIQFANGRVKVGEATLVTSDIACDNGTVHVIDRVLTPVPVQPANIVETLAQQGTFNTLLAAVKAAELETALQGEGPLTIFAPNDAAFAKIPKATLESLLQPENKADLVHLLTYHVVPGNVSAGDALNAGSTQALNQAALPITYKNGGLVAQWAKVLEVDIDGGNGTIHVIDSVMLPPKKSKAKTSVRTERDQIHVIVEAIDKGVPLYNRGHAQACATVYLEASETLLNNCQLDAHAKQSLTHAVKKSQASTCNNTRAWMLRHGLDRAYTALTRAMRETTAQN